MVCHHLYNDFVESITKGDWFAIWEYIELNFWDQSDKPIFEEIKKPFLFEKSDEPLIKITFQWSASSE